LSYACTEDDIQKLFEIHGPLSEVNLPLDKQTNKTIGIGYVTFLMPEHAVKAFNELDGKVFQGRLLHILPSKAKKTENEYTGE
jgi:multiple RNA-binding domain-containing protein 1